MENSETAQKLWTFEYEQSLRKRKYCGHNRLGTAKGACAFVPLIGKCNNKWGCTKLVVITGPFYDSVVFEKLQEQKLELGLLQHITIKQEGIEGGRYLVGAYIGSENCKLMSSAVYENLSKF